MQSIHPVTREIVLPLEKERKLFTNSKRAQAVLNATDARIKDLVGEDDIKMADLDSDVLAEVLHLSRRIINVLSRSFVERGPSESLDCMPDHTVAHMRYYVSTISRNLAKIADGNSGVKKKTGELELEALLTEIAAL